VLSEKELNSLNLTIDELKLIKPYYTTDELDRYYKSKKNKYFIIYTDSTFKNPMTIRPYKNLKNHLDKFVDIITSDNKPYGLHRSRDENFFNNEKIISLRKCSNRPIFTYVDEPSYVSATFFVIKTKRINMKYLTVILNSRLIMFWLRYRGQMQGNNYQVDKNPLLSLPIYYLKEKELTFLNIMQLLKPVVQASNYIFESIPNSHISEAFEEVIDALVFELYFPEEFAEGY
jgi:adenine-specific DNA-methyltransferase